MNNAHKNCEKLLAFLAQQGIERVVFVDDAFEVNSWSDEKRRTVIRERLGEPDEIKSFLLKRRSPEHPNWKQLDPAKEHDKGLLHAAINAYLDGRKKTELLEDYDVAMGDNTYRTYESDLVQCLQSKNKVVGLGPTGWANDGETLMADARPTWYVVDYHLSTSGEKGTAIVAQALAASNCRAVLLISGVLNKGEDSQEWRDVHSEVKDKIPAGWERVLFLSKEEARRDAMSIAFAFQVHNLQPHVERVTKALKTCLERAAETAIKSFSDISDRQLVQLVLTTAVDEGTLLDTNASRVLNLYLREAVAKEWLAKLQEDADCADAVNTLYDRLGNVVSPLDEGSNLAKRLDYLEHYEDGALLNSRHEPIAPGDVFETSGGKKFILLEQPCTVQMRSNGCRQDANQALPTGTAYLVKITPDEPGVPSDSFHAGAGAGPLSFCKILNPSQEGDPASFVNFRNTVKMPLSFLDFCMVNSDGTCRMPPATLPKHAWPGAKVWLQATKGHFDKLHKGQALHLAQLPSVTDPEDRARLDYFQSQERSWPKYPALAFGTTDLTFPLKRTTRLKLHHAQAVMAQFHSYLSRPGFEPPFSRASGR